MSSLFEKAVVTILPDAMILSITEPAFSDVSSTLLPLPTLPYSVISGSVDPTSLMTACTSGSSKAMSTEFSF